MNWENKVSSKGIHYSRYIASWIKITQCKLGTKYDPIGRGHFEKWLKHMDLKDDEIVEILWLADTGKLELEVNLKLFLINKRAD